MSAKAQSKLQTILEYTLLGLLVYMPLHILLSTWTGSSLGVLDLAKGAKDVIVLILFIVSVTWLILQGKWNRLARQPIIYLIATFVFLNAILALVRPTDYDAELIGLTYNVRFLLFAVAAWCIASTSHRTAWLMRISVKAIVVTATSTAIFAILQYTILPDDIMHHFGYSRANGVLPNFFIDDKPDLERVMSTVRDPNAYGSYLLLPISLVGALFLRGKRKPQLLIPIGIIFVLALVFTFSRSALAGLFVSTVVLLLLNKDILKTHTLLVKQTTIFLCVVFVIVVGFVVTHKDSYLAQNLIFHADESTVLADPNELRISLWSESYTAVKEQPLGSGPGTAGIASIHNDQETNLNENYYLQILQETGFIGAILFVAILILAGLMVWRHVENGPNIAGTALLASLAGLVVTNLLVHIWANEAVAYTWWGLWGLYVAGIHKHES